MTLKEFKSWFEGFTENMDGPPNEKQWARIQARVGEVDGTVHTTVTHTYPHYYPYHWNTYAYPSTTVYTSLAGASLTGTTTTAALCGNATGGAATATMHDLGKSDYSSIS